jgi:hypothetical protein
MTVATLTTLADARVLIEQLPEDHRALHRITTQLQQSAAGIEVFDLGIALKSYELSAYVACARTGFHADQTP